MRKQVIDEMLTSNVTVNAMILNTQFDKCLKADDIQASRLTIEAWHNALDKLQSVAYKIFVDGYNGEDMTTSVFDVQPIFDEYKKVIALIGNIDGLKIRCNANTPIAIITKSVNMNASVVSAQLKEYRTQRSKAKKEWEECTNEKVKAVKKETLDRYQKLVEEEEKKALAKTKEPKKLGASSFYKLMEDYIAEAIIGYKMVTEEEEAEKKAKKEAEKKAREEAKEAKKKAKEEAKKAKAEAEKKVEEEKETTSADPMVALASKFQADPMSLDLKELKEFAGFLGVDFPKNANKKTMHKKLSAILLELAKNASEEKKEEKVA